MAGRNGMAAEKLGDRRPRKVSSCMHLDDGHGEPEKSSGEEDQQVGEGDGEDGDEQTCQ